VLFSEPKIPQFQRAAELMLTAFRFSALQRAENSSISALPMVICNVSSFSALQRAENSSMRCNKQYSLQPRWVSVLFSEPKIPQCGVESAARSLAQGFSALQRAENSSIEIDNLTRFARFGSFSALQRAENSSIERRARIGGAAERVSVLFSEPKIPQWK